MSVVKVNSKKTPGYKDKIVAIINPSDGGDSNMSDKYVTKEELKTLETKIDGQFETLNARIDGKFESLSYQIENSNKILWWLMGIVSTGLVVPLLAFIIKALV